MNTAHLALISALLLTAQVQAQSPVLAQESTHSSASEVSDETLIASQCSQMDKYDAAVVLSARCN